MNPAHEFHTPQLSTTAVTRAVAAEFRQVVLDCRRLEVIAAGMFSALSEPADFQELQLFDLTIQRIEGCATVLSNIADKAPLSWMPKAAVLEGVSLSALADRLGGESQIPFNPADDVELW